MPTGYTADIKDGISFETFIINCARAFGACIELRDEPGGGDRIPEAFAPSSYHADALAKARAGLAALEAMTPAELERAAADEYDRAETSRVMRLAEIEAQRAAYEAMLTKAKAWVPPTGEHQGLQSFMVEQITRSIDFDCGTDYYNKPTERLTGSAWADQRRESLARDVSYHTKHYAEDVELAKSRTEWVQQLRASLKPTH
jgi:hypothetical protein